ncbi:predicted protein [Naegleria gruberi]|uniref:Predicted protein n=1 Tax=Naegleria gruberi TaxID=5762 RepID=D2W1R8_NAEGR|nr:uncharacterized protein NAEGRDRAFT_75352 [Naegleria gruberi]EFC37013.1 predicted protein [Naegleria gruberi]|eukprot:XP_002669757.1 predicted protein [Naegleria gruberi strain NEG-M]
MEKDQPPGVISVDPDKFQELKRKLIELFNFKEEIQSIEITSSNGNVNIHLLETSVPSYELKFFYATSSFKTTFCNQIEIVNRNKSSNTKRKRIEKVSVALIDFKFPTLTSLEIYGSDYTAIDAAIREQRRNNITIGKIINEMGCKMVISLFENEQLVSKLFDKFGIIYQEGISRQDLEKLANVLNGEIISDYQHLRSFKCGFADSAELTEDNNIVISIIENTPNVYKDIGILFRNGETIIEVTAIVASYLTLKELFYLSMTFKGMYRSFLDEEHFKKNPDEYHVDLIQNTIWKPMVLFYFPRFQQSLNVKNWMIVMKRRIQHLQIHSPTSLPLVREILRTIDPKTDEKFKIPKPSFSVKKQESFIENCEWIFECPMKYSELERIDYADEKRFCTKCKKHVFRAETMQNFKQIIQEGHCVAYPISNRSEFALGFIRPD